MKTTERTSFIGVRLQIFSPDAAEHIQEAVQSDEFSNPPASLHSIGGAVLLFVENSDKISVLILALAKAISMLRKKEKVSFSVVHRDGSSYSFSCESSDAVKQAGAMLNELQKNSVQDVIINVAASDDSRSDNP